VYSLVGDEGIDYIALTCSRAGAFFLSRPRQDVGIDGHIEFLSTDGHPTGAIAWIQAKAGSSYVTKSDKYVVRANRRQFELWLAYSGPVIGVVYNPDRRDARWINLSEYLQEHRTLIAAGPYQIEAPASQPFSEDTFGVFQAAMEAAHRQTTARRADELINSYLFGSTADREIILSELFAQYRWEPISCFFFHHALRIESDPSVIALLTYLISFYRHHSDRFYGRDFANICPDELKGLALRCIRDYDVREVLKFISAIDDDNGIERGSMGQLVGIQLYDILDITTKLKRIAQDRTLDEQPRRYAVGFLIEYFQDDELYYYEQLLKAENDPDFAEVLQWAVDCIKIWGSG
jgi:hypothetical protein